MLDLCSRVFTTYSGCSQASVCKSQRRYGDSTTCSRAGVTPRRVAWRSSANFLSREPRRGETGLWTPRRSVVSVSVCSGRDELWTMAWATYTAIPYHLAVIRNTTLLLYSESPVLSLSVSAICVCALQLRPLSRPRYGTPLTFLPLLVSPFLFSPSTDNRLD